MVSYYIYNRHLYKIKYKKYIFKFICKHILMCLQYYVLFNNKIFIKYIEILNENNMQCKYYCKKSRFVIFLCYLLFHCIINIFIISIGVYYM
jgi:hypothetical protein